MYALGYSGKERIIGSSWLRIRIQTDIFDSPTCRQVITVWLRSSMAFHLRTPGFALNDAFPKGRLSSECVLRVWIRLASSSLTRLPQALGFSIGQYLYRQRTGYRIRARL